jgi:signal transduction histidine kinase
MFSMMQGSTHRYRNEWILLGVALLCLAAFIGYSLYRDRAGIEAAERDRLQVQAHVIDDNLGRQLEGVNNALIRVRDDLPRWNRRTVAEEGSRLLVALRDAMPGVRAMGLFAADGTTIASTQSEFIGTNVASKRAFFQVPRADPDRNVLFVSPPFLTRVGAFSINVSRAVLDAKGEFIGAVAATLEPAYFEVLLSSVLYAADMRAVLAHEDGTAFLFLPENTGRTGTNLATPGSAFSLHRDSGLAASLFTGRSVVSGDERMIASRTVRPPGLRVNRPLIVHVSRELSSVYAPWRKTAVELCAAYALFASALILGLVFAQRRRRAFDRVASRFEAERQESAARLKRANEELEGRVQERTHALEVANRELEAFSYSVSHDLRAPLRAISGFTRMIEDEYGARLDGPGRALLGRVRGGAERMGDLIDDLLKLSQISRQELNIEPVDLSALAREAAEELRSAEPGRRIEWVIAPGVTAMGDAGLLRVALRNLLGNAWKYSSRREQARIEFGAAAAGGRSEYFVRDNGAGFDMARAGKLFGAFQRLHAPSEFPGTGVGLATVARVLHRHGGDIRAEARVGEGASFYFTL